MPPEVTTNFFWFLSIERHSSMLMNSTVGLITFLTKNMILWWRHSSVDCSSTRLLAKWQDGNEIFNVIFTTTTSVRLFLFSHKYYQAWKIPRIYGTRHRSTRWIYAFRNKTKRINTLDKTVSEHIYLMIWKRNRSTHTHVHTHTQPAAFIRFVVCDGQVYPTEL